MADSLHWNQWSVWVGRRINASRATIINPSIGTPETADPQKRHQRWKAVMALHNKGCGFREISRITGLSRVTISQWVQSGTFPEMSTRPPKRGLLDPWKGWLEE